MMTGTPMHAERRQGNVGRSERNNVLFIAIATSCVAVIGSGVTFALVIAVVWAAVSLLLGRFPFGVEAHQRAFVLIFSSFAIMGYLMVRHHQGSFFGLDGFEYLIFLAPLLMLPRFAIGPDKERLRSTFKYSMAAGGIFAGAIAVAQILYWGARAEGGAGNALAFATVAALAGVGALLLLIEPANRRDRLLGIFGWTGAVIAVVLSQSRTLIVVLMCCSLFLALLNWREITAGLSRAAVILLGCLVLVISAMAASVVVERMSADVLPVAEDVSEPSSAGWRSIYLQAGWRVASQSLIVGVGRADRAHLIGRELEAKGLPTRMQVKIAYSSWHRYLPAFMQPSIVNWQLERWKNAQARHSDGSNIERPHIEATTSERISSPHSHLHNAYMTMLVDHGLIGFFSLAVLLAGPPLMAVRLGLQKSDRAAFQTYSMMVVALALAGVTNVHIENDIVAAYFILLSSIYWHIFRAPTLKGG
ncbi:MAG: O-antigen ligase family protein [Pseudomonadota bacterium]